jgi:hypothetical protein
VSGCRSRCAASTRCSPSSKCRAFAERQASPRIDQRSGT